MAKVHRQLVPHIGARSPITRKKNEENTKKNEAEKPSQE